MRERSCRSGWDTSELLQPVKHALDAVAIFVSLEVASDCLLAVCLRRDDGQDPVHQERRAHVVTVISLVGEHHFRLIEWQIEKRWNSLMIRDFSASQNEAKRAP